MKIFGLEDFPIKTGTMHLVRFNIDRASGELARVNLECIYKDDGLVVEDKYMQRIKELEAEVESYRKMLE